MKSKNALLMLSALLLLAGKPAKAQEADSVKTPLILSADASWLEKYIFRNLLYAPRDVVQSNITLTYGNISGNIFTSFNHAIHKIDEIDFIFTYNIPINDNLSASVYGNHLQLPGQMFPKSTEFGASVSYTAPLDVVLAGTVARDVDASKGTFVGLGISKSVDVEGQSVNLSCELHHIKNYWAPYTGFNGLEAKMCVPIDVSVSDRSKLTFVPSVTQVTAFDKNLFPSTTFFGATMKYETDLTK
jgi:hypothetical protein